MDPDSDLSFLFIDLQDANKKLIKKQKFCISECGTTIQRKPLYTEEGLPLRAKFRLADRAQKILECDRVFSASSTLRFLNIA
jgi:hypothetical protein